jgi:predicted GH43/DUF377 family glycosyl hydrolase
MGALSSKAWTTRTPVSSLSLYQIHRDSSQWPSYSGHCFPELVPRKRHAILRPAWWISIAKASGFPIARRPWQSVNPFISVISARIAAWPPRWRSGGSHRRLAAPVAVWEQFKIGGGTPPILTRHGWLTIYHGVSELSAPPGSPRKLCYSAGVLVLSEELPQVIRFRSREPVLIPELPQERQGIVANVVFPTGIDRRDDLGSPDRFDVYYGMADNRIGVARLDVPKHLPSDGLKDLPQAKT